MSDDQNDQAVSADAFDLMRAIAEKRLKNRRLAVIDATNVRAPERKQWIETARRWLDELMSGAGFLNHHRDDYLAAVNRIRAYRDQTITLYDGLLAVLADQLKFPVWTFDHHFDAMGVTVWR